MAPIMEIGTYPATAGTSVKLPSVVGGKVVMSAWDIEDEEDWKTGRLIHYAWETYRLVISEKELATFYAQENWRDIDQYCSWKLHSQFERDGGHFPDWNSPVAPRKVLGVFVSGAKGKTDEPLSAYPNGPLEQVPWTSPVESHDGEPDASGFDDSATIVEMESEDLSPVVENEIGVTLEVADVDISREFMTLGELEPRPKRGWFARLRVRVVRKIRRRKVKMKHGLEKMQLKH